MSQAEGDPPSYASTSSSQEENTLLYAAGWALLAVTLLLVILLTRNVWLMCRKANYQHDRRYLSDASATEMANGSLEEGEEGIPSLIRYVQNENHRKSSERHTGKWTREQHASTANLGAIPNRIQVFFARVTSLQSPAVKNLSSHNDKSSTMEADGDDDDHHTEFDETLRVIDIEAPDSESLKAVQASSALPKAALRTVPPKHAKLLATSNITTRNIPLEGPVLLSLSNSTTEKSQDDELLTKHQLMMQPRPWKDWRFLFAASNVKWSASESSESSHSRHSALKSADKSQDGSVHSSLSVQSKVEQSRSLEAMCNTNRYTERHSQSTRRDATLLSVEAKDDVDEGLVGNPDKIHESSDMRDDIFNKAHRAPSREDVARNILGPSLRNDVSESDMKARRVHRHKSSKDNSGDVPSEFIMDMSQVSQNYPSSGQHRSISPKKIERDLDAQKRQSKSLSPTNHHYKRMLNSDHDRKVPKSPASPKKSPAGDHGRVVTTVPKRDGMDHMVLLEPKHSPLSHKRRTLSFLSDKELKNLSVLQMPSLPLNDKRSSSADNSQHKKKTPKATVGKTVKYGQVQSVLEKMSERRESLLSKASQISADNKLRGDRNTMPSQMHYKKSSVALLRTNEIELSTESTEEMNLVHSRVRNKTSKEVPQKAVEHSPPTTKKVANDLTPLKPLLFEESSKPPPEARSPESPTRSNDISTKDGRFSVSTKPDSPPQSTAYPMTKKLNEDSSSVTDTRISQQGSTNKQKESQLATESSPALKMSDQVQENRVSSTSSVAEHFPPRCIAATSLSIPSSLDMSHNGRKKSPPKQRETTEAAISGSPKSPKTHKRKKISKKKKKSDVGKKSKLDVTPPVLLIGPSCLMEELSGVTGVFCGESDESLPDNAIVEASEPSKSVKVSKPCDKQKELRSPSKQRSASHIATRGEASPNPPKSKRKRSPVPFNSVSLCEHTMECAEGSQVSSLSDLASYQGLLDGL